MVQVFTAKHHIVRPNSNVSANNTNELAALSTNMCAILGIEGPRYCGDSDQSLECIEGARYVR